MVSDREEEYIFQLIVSRSFQKEISLAILEDSIAILHVRDAYS